MGHKTLIGGTAYEITGGKTLVDGTTYSIKNGKILVGGAAYEVGFAEMVTITVNGTTSFSDMVAAFYINYAGVGVDDGWVSNVSYRLWDDPLTDSSPDDLTFEVPVGTVLNCYIYDEYYEATGKSYAGIDLGYENDKKQVTPAGKEHLGEFYYDHVVTTNTTIDLIHGNQGDYSYGYIVITEF